MIFVVCCVIFFENANVAFFFGYSRRTARVTFSP